MYNIAILGCENSHADAFLSLISDGKYPDINVVGVYSDEPEAVKKLNEKYGTPIMNSYDQLVGKIDGVVITARHGDNHYKYAEPYFASGIPMYIDKPITVSIADALKMVESAKKNNVRLCGGSMCALLSETQELKKVFADTDKKDIIGGSLVFPVSLENNYGGFYFYAQHLVQVVTEIFGNGVKAVTAVQKANGICLICEYDTFCVTGTYGDPLDYYHAEVFTRQGVVSRDLQISSEYFSNEMDSMLSLLKGNEMAYGFDEFIESVFLMNAIDQSIKNGQRVEIASLK